MPAAESGRGGDGKTLSKRIAEAGTPWAVADLVLQDPSVLSAGSIVAALVRMLKLRGASSSDGLPKPSPSLSRAMEVLALSTEELCPAMTPLQLSVVARAFALLSCTDQGLWAALTAEVSQTQSKGGRGQPDVALVEREGTLVAVNFLRGCEPCRSAHPPPA